MNNEWFTKFAGFYNGYPDDYTCIDLETSGLSPTKNQICSYGYTVVRNRQVIETEEVMLNWPTHCVEMGVDRDQLWCDLKSVSAHMINDNKPFHHNWDALEKTGAHPREALEVLLQLVENAENHKELLVAHNGWRFDVAFMQAAFWNHLKVAFEFEANSLYDSGIAEKASQLESRLEPLPKPGESMKEFSKRIGDLRVKGVKWALDGHCEEEYKLLEKCGKDISETHRSGIDSLMLHYLVEQHRKMADAGKQLASD